MAGNDRPLPPITDGEEAEIQAEIATDADNPEWTEADFRDARPFAEVFPGLAAELRRTRDAEAPARRWVSLPIDQDVLDRFEASGPGWETRMNEALRRASRTLPGA